MLKQTTIEEIAKTINNAPIGQEVYFSSGSGDVGDWERWFFAMKLAIKPEDSDFLLIDRCGGGYAYAASIYNDGRETGDICAILQDYAEEHDDIFFKEDGEYLFYIDWD